MTTRLPRSVIDALPQDQRGEIRGKAQALGVVVPGITPAHAGSWPMKVLIYSAALVAVLLTVLSTRLVIPALILLYRAIEAGFAPTDEPVPVSLAVTPIKSTAAT